MRLICSLDAEDIFFNKSLAEKVSGVIISNRLEGTLTGGPFISLSQGKYIARYYGIFDELISNNSSIFVFSEKYKNIDEFQKKCKTLSAKNYLKYLQISFELESFTENIEVRIYQKTGDRFIIDRFELYEIDNKFDADSEQTAISNQAEKDFFFFPDFRNPDELSSESLNLGDKGILLIGQCLIEKWKFNFTPDFGVGFCDYILFNNNSYIDSPPKPLESYVAQVIQIPLRMVLPDLDVCRGITEDTIRNAEKFFASNLENAMKFNIENNLLSFVCNYIIPQKNPSGQLFDRNDKYSLTGLLNHLNIFFLPQIVKKYSNCYILDLEELISSFGKRFISDDIYFMSNHQSFFDLSDILLDKLDAETVNIMKQRHIKSNKFTDEFIKGIWKEVISSIRIINQTASVKIVIIDLDGTLWRGVLAEEGNIDIHYLTEGWPMGFAEAMLALKQRGILLAICSKNNEEIIRKRWKEIFHGRLNIEDFACVKINWNDKVNNVLEILDATNLLPSNAVFIDGNPRERAWIATQFPDMRVLGGNYYDWRRILLYSAETQRSFISDESKRKTEMVQAQVKRVQEMAIMSRDEFLAGLDLSVEISVKNHSNHNNNNNNNLEIKRAFELLNKTNQFNTTGKRWTQTEFSNFLKQGRVFIFSAKDKYSNYGIVGVICELNSVIEQMVMSCRVFGLDVEMAAISCIYKNFYLPDSVRSVRFKFKKTEKNMPAQNFLNKICTGNFEVNENGNDNDSDSDSPEEMIFKMYSPPSYNDKINVVLKLHTAP